MEKHFRWFPLYKIVIPSERSNVMDVSDLDQIYPKTTLQDLLECGLF